MRIIKVDSNNWSNEINIIEENTINNISNDIISLLSGIDGYVKHDKYKIYKDQKVLDGLKITFVFTIKSDILKNETFIYTMYTNTQNDFYTLEINLKKDKKIFKINDYEEIKKYILNDLYKNSCLNSTTLSRKFFKFNKTIKSVSNNILAF